MTSKPVRHLLDNLPAAGRPTERELPGATFGIEGRFAETPVVQIGIDLRGQIRALSSAVIDMAAIGDMAVDPGRDLTQRSRDILVKLMRECRAIRGDVGEVARAEAELFECVLNAREQVDAWIAEIDRQRQ